jgi:radical SAM family uncharacterized protein/radical SAM-linked protein
MPVEKDIIEIMQDFHLNGVEKPGRYIGLEVNAWRKTFESASVRFVLAFPDVYEIGFSHLGLQLLYHQLNGIDGVMADRVYSPWPDYEVKLRSAGEPLRGIESEHALSDFEFVGITLQYELSYSNILTILDLAPVPLYARDRTTGHPFVIGGGPCAFNPEPLADFFDFFVLGEAEEVLPEIIGIYKDWKKSPGADREGFLADVRRVAGVYVPSFFDVRRGAGGIISAVVPRFSDYTGVRKRVVSDLDESCPIPEKPLVPLIDVVHNRMGLEIARGCTRGCRFCQAGFIYRPVRERHPLYVREAAKKALASSGFEDVSLLSLSTGDYCGIQDLLGALTREFEPRKIAVSFPSMRVGTLTSELMEHVRRVRKTGFTLAPEAGSERLRRIINKGVCDDDLLDAAQSAFDLGWRVLKLYFMMGLPGETEADRDAIIDLSLRVWEKAKRTKAAVNIAISTFVPKSMTPFQWASQMPVERMEDCLKMFRERLRKPGLRTKWGRPDGSVLEAAFARGGRELSVVIRRAWELGARFDGWSDHFNPALWHRAFAELELDTAFYAERSRDREEILPWDHLSAGVSRDYLWNEYEKAMGEESTADCRRGPCTLCGVCDHESISPLVHEGPVIELKGERRPECAASSREDQEFLYRVIYSRVGRARFFGQLEMAAALERAVRRAGLPASFTKGHNPHPKISFGEALPLGMETLIAEAHVALSENLEPNVVRERLGRECNGVMKISSVSRVDGKPVKRGPCRAVYHISGLNPFVLRHLLDAWPKCGDNALTKKTKKGEATTRLGEVLLDMRKAGEGSLEMDIYETPALCFRPLGILQNLAGAQAGLLENCLICKIASYRLEVREGNDNVGRTNH